MKVEKWCHYDHIIRDPSTPVAFQQISTLFELSPGFLGLNWLRWRTLKAISLFVTWTLFELSLDIAKKRPIPRIRTMVWRRNIAVRYDWEGLAFSNEFLRTQNMMLSKNQSRDDSPSSTPILQSLTPSARLSMIVRMSQSISPHH